MIKIDFEQLRKPFFKRLFIFNFDYRAAFFELAGLLLNYVILYVKKKRYFALSLHKNEFYIPNM